MPNNAAGLTVIQSTSCFKGEDPTQNEVGIHQLESCLDADDAERSADHAALLFFFAMRSVIGCDAVDRAVQQTFDQSCTIFSTA